MGQVLTVTAFEQLAIARRFIGKGGFLPSL
jgi:hypothetical protein